MLLFPQFACRGVESKTFRVSQTESPNFGKGADRFQEWIIERRAAMRVNADDFAEVVVKQLSRQCLPTIRGVVTQCNKEISIVGLNDATSDIDDGWTASHFTDLMEDRFDLIQSRRFVCQESSTCNGYPGPAVCALAETEIDRAGCFEIVSDCDIEKAGLTFGEDARNSFYWRRHPSVPNEAQAPGPLGDQHFAAWKECQGPRTLKIGGNS